MTVSCNHPTEARTEVKHVQGDLNDIYWKKQDGLYPSPTDERRVFEVHRMLRPIYTVVLCNICGNTISRDITGNQVVEGPHTITYTDTSRNN